MNATLVGAVVIAAVGVVMVALAVVARWLRRRGTAGSAISAAMAAYDEAWHTSAHDTFVEVQAQKDRTAETPAPRAPKNDLHNLS